MSVTAPTLMNRLNATHDPSLQSWVESANRPDCDFPIQNLPFAVFQRRGTRDVFRGGVAIGDQILDLAAVNERGVIRGAAANPLAAASQCTLNGFMELGFPAWSALRSALSDVLRAGSAARSELETCLVARDEADYAVPVRIGDYTDFYTSIYHATAVGRLFRPDNPLLPNYHWVPIGYHGRSSSIRVSGQSFPRPCGQTLAAGAAEPAVGPSKRLDCELELGIYVGVGNPMGVPIRMQDAESHIFGMCLLNDWSARDLQAWEYQPLGPFLSKNFATTISPWIVTLEALAPFRLPFDRPAGVPAPLPYLDSPANRAGGAIDIQLELKMQTSAMRGKDIAAQRLSRTSYRHAYWTAAQLISHHTINGCNLQGGDLLGTGTQSGPTPGEAGSLLELTAGGRVPFKVGEGESRTFFEDGDAALMRGWCERIGARSIGFGEVAAEVQPALDLRRDT
jgi:fumarylacetoacetase